MSSEARELTKAVLRGLVPLASGHYIVYDRHPDAPKGFGIRVSKTAKTFIVKVRHGARVVTSTVGRYPDLSVGRDVPNEKNARFVASELSRRIRGGENVAETQRSATFEAQANAKTLGDLFDDWVEQYEVERETKKKLSKKNTLLAVAKAKRRLGSLVLLPAHEVTFLKLKAAFTAIAKDHQTAAEQTVRWVSTIYNRANERMELAADGSDVNVRLYRNPAAHFGRQGLLRSRAELENDFRAKGARNPLTDDMLVFRKWLDYVLSARETLSGRSASDYLLIALIMGYRKNEVKKLRWFDSVDARVDKFANWVDLKRNEIVLNDTKSGYQHVLPIPDYCKQLLTERLEGRPKNCRWVFPAVSKSHLRRTEHYTDSRSFIAGVKKAVGLSFSEHDMRRTFGNVANLIAVPDSIIKQLINHRQAGGVTSIYTAQTRGQLLEVLNKIESKILSFASSRLKPTFG